MTDKAEFIKDLQTAARGTLSVYECLRLADAAHCVARATGLGAFAARSELTMEELDQQIAAIEALYTVLPMVQVIKEKQRRARLAAEALKTLEA